MHGSEIGSTLDYLTAKLFADENHTVWCVAACTSTHRRDGIALTPWQQISPHHVQWEMIPASPTVDSTAAFENPALCFTVFSLGHFFAPVSPCQGHRYLQVCGTVHLRNLKYPVNTDSFLSIPELNPAAAGTRGNLPID